MRAALLICLFLAGCTCYNKPDMPLTGSFSEGEPVERCGGIEADLAAWWLQFNDPILNGLIEEAIACSYDLNLAREKVCYARSQYEIARGRLFPEVDAFANFTRSRNSENLTNSAFLGTKFFNFFQVGFDTTWELDIFGRLNDLRQASLFDAVSAAETVRNVRVTVVGEVARFYVAIRAYQEKVRITSRAIEEQKVIYQMAISLYKGGLTSNIEVQQARVILDDLEATLPSFLAALKASAYSLGSLLGRPPEYLNWLICDQGSIPCSENKIPLGLPSTLLCRRGDIRAAEYAFYASGARLSAAKKELLPTLPLTGVFSWAADTTNKIIGPASRLWFAQASPSWTLFKGGQIQGDIHAATSLQKQAVIAYEATVVKALQEVESALGSYFEENRRYYELEDAVKASRQTHLLNVSIYTGGLVPFTNVEQALVNLYSAENALVDNRLDQMTYLIAVYKALGGGWECSY